MQQGLSVRQLLLPTAWVALQMSRTELGRLRSCKGANRKLLSRLNIVKRVRAPARPCAMQSLQCRLFYNVQLYAQIWLTIGVLWHAQSWAWSRTQKKSILCRHCKTSWMMTMILGPCASHARPEPSRGHKLPSPRLRAHQSMAETMKCL